MPAEILTKRWFAKVYGWSPEQLEQADLDILTWFPLIEEAEQHAQEVEQKQQAAQNRAGRLRGCVAGADEALAKLRALRVRTPVVADLAATAMAAVAMREVQRQLGLTEHSLGTPTPSAPGEPPSLVTGQLRRSVRMIPKGRAHVQVGATTVYARIQELGGDAGRGHATHLPRRPYLAAALKKVTESGALTKAAAKVIRAALEA
jgi:phage gpG-like protein